MTITIPRSTPIPEPRPVRLRRPSGFDASPGASRTAAHTFVVPVVRELPLGTPAEPPPVAALW